MPEEGAFGHPEGGNSGCLLYLEEFFRHFVFLRSAQANIIEGGSRFRSNLTIFIAILLISGIFGCTPVSASDSSDLNSSGNESVSFSENSTAVINVVFNTTSDPSHWPPFPNYLKVLDNSSLNPEEFLAIANNLQTNPEDWIPAEAPPFPNYNIIPLTTPDNPIPPNNSTNFESSIVSDNFSLQIEIGVVNSSSRSDTIVCTPSTTCYIEVWSHFDRYGDHEGMWWDGSNWRYRSNWYYDGVYYWDKYAEEWERIYSDYDWLEYDIPESSWLHKEIWHSTWQEGSYAACIGAWNLEYIWVDGWELVSSTEIAPWTCENYVFRSDPYIYDYSFTSSKYEVGIDEPFTLTLKAKNGGGDAGSTSGFGIRPRIDG